MKTVTFARVDEAAHLLEVYADGHCWLLRELAGALPASGDTGKARIDWLGNAQLVHRRGICWAKWHASIPTPTVTVGAGIDPTA